MQKQHLKSLTSVRFLAAFWVVAYHNAHVLEPLVPASLPFLRSYLHTGYLGVNLFFLLSGFILSYTYLDPDRPPSIDTRKFWVARFARIYPLYFVALAVVAPLVVIHFLSTNPPGVGALKIGVSGFGNLLLAQAWVPQLKSIWNPPGWTLSVEAFYYLSFPLAASLLWRLRRGRAKLALIVVWLVGLVPPVAASLLLPPPLTQTPATGVLPHSYLLDLIASAPLFRLPEFLFGILLARAYFPHHGRVHGEIGPRRSAVIVAASVASLFLALGLADRMPRLWVNAGLLDPLFGMLLIGLPGLRGVLQKVLSMRVAVLLGEASYALYILQDPIAYWLFRAFPSGLPHRLGIAYFALYLSIAILVSLAAFRWIEDPTRRWIRGRFAKPAAKPRPLPEPAT